MNGTKYSRKTDKLLGTPTFGSIITFPTKATITAVIATNIESHPAFSGRGNELRFTFNSMFPIPNSAITNKKEMV
jgi:biotin transporter BioY